MKKFLIGLLALGSISAFAGSLLNTENGKSIELTRIRELVQVKNLRNEGSVDNIILYRIEMKKIDNHFTATTENVSDYLDNYWINNPLIVIPAYVGAVVFDGLVFPIRATKALLGHKAQKDFRKLSHAISSNNQIEVSDARFNRIRALLLKTL